MKLSRQALTVLEKRYLKKDEKGHVLESPQELFQRVAHTASLNNKSQYIKFLKLLTSLEFLPNSPALMNAGTSLGQLSACFVIPVEDSLESIFEALKDMAIIQQSGGGTGFSFSNLRPKGDVVKTTHGIASGPVSFMKIFNTATEVIKQGGRRRGANMGILSVHHPDILEFIKAKVKEREFSNFNLSVAISDRFMRAVLKNKKYELVNPRTKKTVQKLKARKVFNLIAKSAWSCGDPGLIFIDEINRKHPQKYGRIQATNPCGEQPLLPYESCNLGSINLTRMLKKKDFDWKKLKETVHLSIKFLDNLISANHYPLPQIEKITKRSRKIGLGVMGWAEVLIKLNIRYNSEEALRLAEKLMRFISIEARKASKGRNATLLSIAPTGTLSLIADTTPSIEPLFALSYKKKVLGGVSLPKKFKKTEAAVTALEIAPEWHVRMQAAFQKYTDSAVSKTVNLKRSAKVKDVKKVFLLAYKLKCKGITVYRYGSLKEQVLYIEDSGCAECRV